MYTNIKIPEEEIDSIVTEELKRSHAVVRNMDEYGLEVDTELTMAIEIVLEYYMTKGEYSEWVKKSA